MLIDRFRLDDRVAIITAAGRGIGAASALAFAEAGADVVISARTESQLDEWRARQVEGAGPGGRGPRRPVRPARSSKAWSTPRSPRFGPLTSWSTTSAVDADAVPRHHREDVPRGVPLQRHHRACA
jgi:7-alpha-hydroxysteroid dehydrogenase